MELVTGKIEPDWALCANIAFLQPKINHVAASTDRQTSRAGDTADTNDQASTLDYIAHDDKPAGNSKD